MQFSTSDVTVRWGRLFFSSVVVLLLCCHPHFSTCSSKAGDRRRARWRAFRGHARNIAVKVAKGCSLALLTIVAAPFALIGIGPYLLYRKYKGRG
jgi:hypothetical protein